MYIRLITPLVLALPFLLAGCGNGQQGYLALPSSASAQFLQVTRNGSSLSGSLQDANISSSDPTVVTTFNVAFTGTTNGSQITLTFPQGLGFSTSVSGSYSGDHIDLSVPQTDGTLAIEDFAPSDTNAYNNAVHQIRQQAQQSQADQQAATAAQQQAQQEAAQRAAVDKAISAVNDDINRLNNALGEFTNLYGSINGDQQQAFRDTVMAYNDLKKVSAEGPSSLSCGADAGVVAADAGVVEADLGTIEADQGAEQSDVQAVNDDVRRVDTDFAGFQAAQAAIPTYQPGAVPTSEEMTQAHSVASKANAQVNATIAAALKQVQGWVKQANQYADNAAAICG
jgi:hypothetical protein